MKFHFAPIQGHTDAPYRFFHSRVYGGSADYYTPFIRLERGAVRQRDLKDVTTGLNDSIHLIPQIIFRDENELKELVSQLKATGVKEIDLNMGCPFPLQTGHGRGAATVANPVLAEAVARIVEENSDIVFSLKMRLGMSDPFEWKNLISSLNRIDLHHITVHPRVARQQYGGELWIDSFEEILSESKNPVVFNGDIRSFEEIDNVIHRFGNISGIMIGRGLLGRPSLVAEYLEGKEWSHEERIEKMLEFHSLLLDYYSENLCGDSQLLSKIRPFWEYAEEEIGRKPWKAIRKATNIAKYHSAVAMIQN